LTKGRSAQAGWKGVRSHASPPRERSKKSMQSQPHAVIIGSFEVPRKRALGELVRSGRAFRALQLPSWDGWKSWTGRRAKLGVRSVTTRQIARPKPVRLVRVSKGMRVKRANGRSSQVNVATHLHLAVIPDQQWRQWEGGRGARLAAKCSHQSDGYRCFIESKHSATSRMWG